MVLLSKNKIKYIHSLELKKIRKEERVFLSQKVLKLVRRFTRTFSLLFPGSYRILDSGTS